MLLVHALITLSNMLYVRHLGQLHFNLDLSFLKRPLLKEMANFSLYGFLGSMGSRLSSDFISIFMVGTMSTLTNSGVFYIAYLISNVIDVPRKAIAKIAAPLLAEKIKEDNWEEVQDIYQKTSLNQLIIGLGLLLAVWVSIDELFHIMPNGELYEAGKMVILVLGIGRVVDMVTGVNSGIISFSKYFRWNFYFILFTAVVNIAGNFILIPRFEILGAALAVLLSLVLFNAAKCLLLYWKLRMNPFTPATFYSIFFAALFGVPISLLPGPTGWVMIDLAIKSGAFLALYGGAVLYFRLSPDINSLVENALHRLKSYIGK
jgi:O-antigen/teichoic acid export membrane protein